MSSAIDVYVVDLDRLEQIVGSGDQAAIDGILAERADFLSRIDDIDDEAEMSCADAVADLINGTTPKDGRDYLYGYALEAICAHIGKELPNICPIARATQWIAEVDADLEKKNVPISLRELVFGGSPVDIPEDDDYPAIGGWSASEISTALKALQSMDLNGAKDENAETYAQIKGWLEEASKRPGASIIGFLS